MTIFFCISDLRVPRKCSDVTQTLLTDQVQQGCPVWESTRRQRRGMSPWTSEPDISVCCRVNATPLWTSLSVG